MIEVFNRGFFQMAPVLSHLYLQDSTELLLRLIFTPGDCVSETCVESAPVTHWSQLEVGEQVTNCSANFSLSQELSAGRLWLLLTCLQLAMLHQIFYVREPWPMDCSQTYARSNCFDIPTLTVELMGLRSSPSYNRQSVILKVTKNLPSRQKIAIETFPPI